MTLLRHTMKFHAAAVSLLKANIRSVTSGYQPPFTQPTGELIWLKVPSLNSVLTHVDTIHILTQSAVGTVTRQRAGRPRYHLAIPDKEKRFFSCSKRPYVPWVPTHLQLKVQNELLLLGMKRLLYGTSYYPH
jgi:hypothetical protein